MALGMWHFAAKSYIDVKYIYSRFGNNAIMLATQRIGPPTVSYMVTAI